MVLNKIQVHQVWTVLTLVYIHLTIQHMQHLTKQHYSGSFPSEYLAVTSTAAEILNCTDAMIDASFYVEMKVYVPSTVLTVLTKLI